MKMKDGSMEVIKGVDTDIMPGIRKMSARRFCGCAYLIDSLGREKFKPTQIIARGLPRKKY